LSVTYNGYTAIQPRVMLKEYIKRTNNIPERRDDKYDRNPKGKHAKLKTKEPKRPKYDKSNSKPGLTDDQIRGNPKDWKNYTIVLKNVKKMPKMVFDQYERCRV